MTSSKLLLATFALISIATTGGCGSKQPKPHDGGTDGPKAEVGADTSPDLGSDVRAEASVDTSPDLAADTSPSDGSEDASPDTSADAPSDVGPADALSDVGPACVDMDGACIATIAVFNTGVDSNGVALPGGSVDPHYKLLQSAETTLPGPDAIVTTHIAEGYWVPQGTDAKWIAPSANQSYPGATPCNAAGTYVFRTTFDLTGFDPTTAKIVGQWGADNTGTAVRLNGVSLGLTAASYAPLTAFTITSGFVAGTNTLDFEILDYGCPNGLRVEMTGTVAAGGG